MSRRRFKVHEAKTHFSKLLKKVANGEEIEIFKGSELVARMVPVSKKKVDRKFTFPDEGKFKIADDFDAPIDLLDLDYDETST